MNDYYNELKEFTKGLGVDLFGAADITSIRDGFAFSPTTKNKFHRAVCIGIGLIGAILDDINDEPTRIYFQHYRTLNNILDQAAIRIASFIEKKCFKALPIPASQIIDWQNQTAHLSHKEVGYLAGLGWRGRNNLLVNENLGSQFRLATILTDLDLTYDKPKDRDCGECVACIKVCPAGAIQKEKKDFKYIECFEKLKEFQRKKIVDQYICGVCVKACRGISNLR